MVPVAPALLSITKLPPPVFSGSFCAMTRAMASVEPPGGKGTTMVTGLSAGQAARLAVAAMASARPIRVFFMGLVSWVGTYCGPSLRIKAASSSVSWGFRSEIGGRTGPAVLPTMVAPALTMLTA